MTPEEKANDLVEAYIRALEPVVSWDLQIRYAKQCAIMCVDRIIMVTPAMRGDNIRIENYWQSVKKEIEAL